LAKGDIKHVITGYTKGLGLFRQPQTGPVLPVDGLSNLPVNTKVCGAFAFIEKMSRQELIKGSLISSAKF
jgi:hypothetical protein